MSKNNKPIVPSKPRHKGVPVLISGNRYLVPGLTWEQYEEHGPTLAKFHEAQDVAAIFTIYGPIVACALRRNYPELSDDFLRKELDINTFRECLGAVQGALGLTVLEPGEE